MLAGPVPPRVSFRPPMGAAAALAAPPAVEAWAVALKGTDAWDCGLPLHKEAGESNSLMAARREPHHLAHVGADVRLPGTVGPFVSMVDMTHRVGQCVLLWVPIDIRKALV